MILAKDLYFRFCFYRGVVCNVVIKNKTLREL